jgi:hypothetical protein
MNKLKKNNGHENCFITSWKLVKVEKNWKKGLSDNYYLWLLLICGKKY